MSALTDLGRRVQRQYAGGQRRPLAGYLVPMGVYGALAASLSAAARLTGRRPPERVGAGDVLLMTFATHKLSRLLTKDAVTSPLRAPFTRYAGPAGDAEVNEEVRDDGVVRHAVGEMLTCPFCTDMWVASAFAAGLVFAPRLTRLASATLTAVAGSDFLQLAYDAAKHLPERASG